MALEYPDKIKASTQGFAIADTRELAGHKQVNTLANLYTIPDAWLSPSVNNTDNDAIGQLWYVVSEQKYYQLAVWADRTSADGWIPFSFSSIIKTSQLINNGEGYFQGEELLKFITRMVDDLYNYYTIDQVNDLLADLNAFKFIPCKTLPTENINVRAIYLLEVVDGKYSEEWVYVEKSTDTWEWEQIGTTKFTVKVATTSTHGVVKIGDGIELNSDGVISVVFPTSLKNPQALQIVKNGTTINYDGSAAQTITITDPNVIFEESESESESELESDETDLVIVTREDYESVIKSITQEITPEGKEQARENIGIPESVLTLPERVDMLEMASSLKDYYVAGWDVETLSPEPIVSHGDQSFADEWYPYLIDVTDITEVTTVAARELQRNNYFRFTDGTFAPTVGITEEMRAACDVALYFEDGTLICDALEFDPAQYYIQHGLTPIFDADGDPVRQLLPWETTSKNYTIGIGRREDIYLCDAIGKSGFRWKGIFKHPIVWDGIDLTPFKLARTAISPGPIALNVDTPRNFFFLYEIVGGTSHTGYGDAAIDIWLDGRTYPRTHYDTTAISMMTRARALNSSPLLSYPAAEGGYHALNAFITSQETLYATNYLHNNALFGSGVSSNDSCTDETSWNANGGVRTRVTGTTDWEYKKWSDNCQIAYNNLGQKTAISYLLNYNYAKEECMEAQMAASWLTEFDLDIAEEFEFYGNTYRVENIPTTLSLSEGRMNCKVFRLRESTNVEAFDGDGEATNYDIECQIRVSLTNGMTLSGDISVYWNGGVERIINCIDPEDGSPLNPVDNYLQPDQTKWHQITTSYLANNGEFDFESNYMYLGQSKQLGYAYSRKRLGYTPSNLLTGGGLSTGECFYSWDRQYYVSEINRRTRHGVLFRGYSPNTDCAPRTLISIRSVAHTCSYYGGSAQFLIRDAVATQSQ